MTTTPNPSSVFGSRKATPAAAPETMSQPIWRGDVLAAELPRDEEARVFTHELELGNPELPIAAYREQIVDAVNTSQVVVITAETGAGKSTQVPQFLAEEGYEVIITQPRIVAARNVAGRIGDEVVDKRGPEFANFAGYRTAYERGDSPENQILAVTDGLQLMRELYGKQADGKKRVLLLDEVHEWNENMEVLVAWAKKRVREDPDFKVVIMSATMEAGPLAAYFADASTSDVPVIEVPGRTYPVEMNYVDVEASTFLYDVVATQAARSAKAGENVLVFVPGVPQINKVIDALADMKLDTEIVPLYGKQSKAEQQAAFTQYGRPKIVVATNVAETSITIPDIDTVVDTGEERREEMRHGVSGTYIVPISQANIKQRAGRAGRTKEGKYYLVSPIDYNNRDAYATPEILRTSLDGMVLRLANAGLDAAEMDFYHKKDNQGRDIATSILQAKKLLQGLGAITEQGQITNIGRQMNKMSLESHFARMVVEARKYDKIAAKKANKRGEHETDPNESKEVRLQLIAALAALEVGGIMNTHPKKPQRWRSLLQREVEPGDESESINSRSDGITQLKVFLHAINGMSYTEMKAHDINPTAVSATNAMYRQLRKAEGLYDVNLSLPSLEQEELLRRCMIAGMVDNVWVKDGSNTYKNASGDVRELGAHTTVGDPTNIVVATPLNIQFELQSSREKRTKHILTNITNVSTVGILRNVAPHLIAHKHPQLVIGADGYVVQKSEVHFNGLNTGEHHEEKAEKSEQTSELLVREAVGKAWWGQASTVESQINSLQHRTTEQLAKPTYTMMIEQALADAAVLEIDTLEEALQCVPEIEMESFVSADKQAEILAAAPDTWSDATRTYKLNYLRGVPSIADWLNEEELLALDAAAMVLPDGRPIRSPNGGMIAADQETTMANRKIRAEAEKARHTAAVDTTLRYLHRGFTLEQAAGGASEAVKTEAQALYLAEKEAAEAATRLAEAAAQREYEENWKRIEAMEARAPGLLTANDTAFNKLDEIDAYDGTVALEIRREVIALRKQLDELRAETEDELNRAHKAHGGVRPVSEYETRLNNLNSRVTQVLKQYAQWQNTQDYYNGAATKEDLSALLAHFNKR